MAFKANKTKLSKTDPDQAEVSGETKSWYSENKNITVIALVIAIAIAIISIATMLFGFGESWVSVLKNKWSLVIIILVGVIFTVKLTERKLEIKEIRKMASVILIIAVICFVGSRIWMVSGETVCEWFAPQQPSEYSYGKYEISLKKGETSEWINFKANMKFDYFVSTKDCGSDSLIVIYSDGEEVTMWGDEPFLSIGRDSGREAKIKLAAFADLEKITFRVEKKS